jgi:hypothetical protein
MTADHTGDAPSPKPAQQPARHYRALTPPDPTPRAFTQHVGDAYLHWSVTEVDAHTVPGALGARCLLFARPDCIRRVWHYPADWRTLDDAALTALSWQR